MKKSENCCRINASKTNFGRIGPSGEVRVRQRLKKVLRRSLDPEEIQEEMSRDKGYGGYSKITKVNMDAMDRSKAAVARMLELQNMSGTSGDSAKSTGAEDDSDGHVYGDCAQVSL